MVTRQALDLKILGSIPSPAVSKTKMPVTGIFGLETGTTDEIRTHFKRNPDAEF